MWFVYFFVDQVFGQIHDSSCIAISQPLLQLVNIDLDFATEIVILISNQSYDCDSDVDFKSISILCDFD